LKNVIEKILAFGRHGDMVTAFSLVDEMVSNRLKLSKHTLITLLGVCASNKETGFKYAIEVS